MLVCFAFEVTSRSVPACRARPIHLRVRLAAAGHDGANLARGHSRLASIGDRDARALLLLLKLSLQGGDLRLQHEAPLREAAGFGFEIDLPLTLGDLLARFLRPPHRAGQHALGPDVDVLAARYPLESARTPESGWSAPCLAI